MGYGKNLEREIKERNMSVKEVAEKAKISPTTLYSAIQEDRSISYGNAIKIYRVLSPKIDMRTICNDVPADDLSLQRTSLSEYLKVGEKMKAARNKEHLGSGEVAKLLKLSPQSYSNYENGYSQPPTEILLPFCEIVHLTLGELLGTQIPVPASAPVTFGMIRPLLSNHNQNDEQKVIIIFDGEGDDKNIELKISHPILNSLEHSPVEFISTLNGINEKNHISICIKKDQNERDMI
ncbi:MAG: helix-turn-helix transcriptional regulator [Lachnospiraceae bacterium]|nr:helix-turn-helix transcriptional regulator [Lachnospiraceae bacterium]